MKNSFIKSTDRKTWYLFLFLLTFLFQPLFSQSMLKHDTPAPEVGSLLRVQSLPVDLYSGRANVSIPLYSIALKKYSYDIQLLYNSEGNKTDLPVGKVGLGWSITGGQIYRVANAHPDEIHTFSEYPDRTEMPDWNQESNLSKYYNPFTFNEDYLHEPDLDEFMINIGKINASFYMYRDRAGNIQTRISSQNSPYFMVKDIKIGKLPDILLAESVWKHPAMDKTYHPQLYIVPSTQTITEITIVDSEGITYVFGGDINTIDLSCRYSQDSEYSNHYDIYGRLPRLWDGSEDFSAERASDSFHSFFFGTASTWHIKKIILPDQENIVFNYSKGNVNIIESLDHHKTSTIKFSGDGLLSNTIPGMTQLPFDVNPQYLFLVDKKYDIVYPSLLTSVRASNGDQLNFISSKRNDLSIHGFYGEQNLFLRDNYGSLIQTILDKSYLYKLDEIKAATGNVKFHYTDQNDRRLRLDSLTVNNTQKYKFQYNPLKLPEFNQMLSDNWGYYNGNKYLSEVNLQRFETLYNYRKPDSTYVKAEILEKITYPTGGEISLEYEPHTYSKIATQYPFGIKQENGVAGGVRIKSITISEDKQSSEKIVKEYLYQNEDMTSSGILSVVPNYFTNGTGNVDYESEVMTVKGPYSYTHKATNNISWTDGFHMGYSRVTEKLSNGSQTTYNFTNHDQIQDEPSVGAFTLGMNNDMYNRYTSRKLDRGLLKSVDYYDTSMKLLKEEAYIYHSDLSDYLKTIERYAFMNTLPIRVSANKIYTYFPFLQKKETTLYTDQGSIKETEEYKYNKFRLLTCTKKYTNDPNDNNMIETSIKHLSDLMEEYDRYVSTSISVDYVSKVYDTMRSQGLLSYPIETVVKRNGRVTSAEVMTYKMFDKFVVQDKLYKLESDAPLSNYSSFKLLNSAQCAIDERCMVEMEYLDFDKYTNPTSVVDKTGTKTAYVWGYNGLYPIAKVVNARNTFKSIPRYREVRETEYVDLKNALSNYKPYCAFDSSKEGIVEISLIGSVGYNWFISGYLDNKSFTLVQTRSNDKVGYPWPEYKKAYPFKTDFFLPAGSHRLTITFTEAYKSASQSTYEGLLCITHWAQQWLDPETSGTDDVFYENFESTNIALSSFGHQSRGSHVGSYAVSMATNPEREYVIDYQMFKNGKWNYMKHNFINNCDTIDEGLYPIDDVRVYPKDALINTYSYFPLIGLRSKTNERGVCESYKYDEFGKLLSVMDNDMNIIKKYDYFYQDQAQKYETIYYNTTLFGTFTRNTCDKSLGESGKSIDYVVPARKHSSLISQEDVNQKAYDDLLNNGQQYANEHAECNSNIIISVYNPTNTNQVLTFNWGPQAYIMIDEYQIPPSLKIADTGNILNDYEPTKLFIPRKYYRSTWAAPQDDLFNHSNMSIKSVPYNSYIDYSFETYPDPEDIYVIGGYPFAY